ncbi:MAG: hypothetical protein LBT46_13015 [Planctomycetaceae bacterium]|jgi:hypothetical protein|nr:hypothetical protein [Planctomycetaceae bacterium]
MKNHFSFSLVHSPFILSLVLFAGCQSVLLTALVLVKGTDEPPKYSILLKGEKRVAVVARSMIPAYELQGAPREVARQVAQSLDDNTRNKKLHIVEQSKVESWLDNCNHVFESFTEVGQDKTINADIVIGIDIAGFQIRDPQSAYLVQGKCSVNVKAIDCKTGQVLASETLNITDPPNIPLQGGVGLEAAFRPQFIGVVAQRIAALFHHYDKKKINRFDADNLDMTRIE